MSAACTSRGDLIDAKAAHRHGIGAAGVGDWRWRRAPCCHVECTIDSRTGGWAGGRALAGRGAPRAGAVK